MITGGPLIALAPFKIPETKPAVESTDGCKVIKLRRDVHNAITDKSKTKAIANRTESSETCDKASKPKAGPLPGEIALAVVGAHMSGLPLNQELALSGGRFLFAGKTAPEYRIYALAGGPPSRPGMVRTENGERIPLEVWALPTESFGAFVDNIPQPLVIGTVNLEVGSSVKGFLCESSGLECAKDITSYGGWRNYLDQV